jgi:hypothetical protein
MSVDPLHHNEPGVTDNPSVRRRGHLIGVAAAIGIAVIVAIGAVVALLSSSDGDGAPSGGASQEASQTPLEGAKETCARHTPAVRVGDGGRSRFVERVAAEEDEGAGLDQLACILTHIDVPDAVVSQMDGTRALDGRQQAGWDGFTASWTYHPDDGLNLIIQETG